MRFLRDNRGSQSLEFVALIPLVVLLLIFMAQGAMAVHAAVVASAAARDGARFYSVGYSEEEVIGKVSQELAGIPMVYCRPGKNSQEVWVELKVKVPVIGIPLLEKVDLELPPVKAVMPNTEES